MTTPEIDRRFTRASLHLLLQNYDIYHKQTCRAAVGAQDRLLAQRELEAINVNRAEYTLAPLSCTCGLQSALDQLLIPTAPVARTRRYEAKNLAAGKCKRCPRKRSTRSKLLCDFHLKQHQAYAKKSNRKCRDEANAATTARQARTA